MEFDQFKTVHQLNNFCEDNGMKRQLLAPKTPQKNGIAKRKNRLVSDAARAMMLEGNEVHIYWREAILQHIHYEQRSDQTRHWLDTL